MHVVLFVLISALAPLLEGAEPVIMRIHHTAPLDHQITLALHAFALDVEERSNGRIDVDVVTKPRPMIPAPQFAKAVASGELEAACMPNFLWTGTIPQMGFSMIPYLFTEKQQMEAFPESRAAEYLEDKLAAQGVKTLAWLHVTRATVFTSERPILEPGVFKGLRIRTMSEVARYPFEKVGGKPQRLTAGFVPAAIERGELDAVMTDVSSSIGLELYELHKSATLAPYFSAFYHLYVDPDWLDNLAPELRRAVVEASETLTKDGGHDHRSARRRFGRHLEGGRRSPSRPIPRGGSHVEASHARRSDRSVREGGPGRQGVSRAAPGRERGGGNALTALRALALLGVAAFGSAAPAHAQISRLPASVQEALAEIGPKWRSDIRTYIPRTFELFAPLLEAAPKDGVTVTEDIAFGEDPKQKLDLFRPDGVDNAPVVVFVHGGALTRGDKSGRPGVYDNVLYFFARHGMVGVNANYRLAPQNPFPDAAIDMGLVVAWIKAHADEFGGDPERIFLIGHSSGGTHVATWAYDPSIHGADGPGIAGVVLSSGRLKADNRADDPNAAGVEAYFGTDTSLYPSRSPLTHGPSSPLPTFIVIAEYENPFLDVYGAELFSRMCTVRGRCPRFTRVLGHNHISTVASFNTADEALGLEILDFIRLGR